jgi:hypothetical protein
MFVQAVLKGTGTARVTLMRDRDTAQIAGDREIDPARRLTFGLAPALKEAAESFMADFGYSAAGPWERHADAWTVPVARKTPPLALRPGEHAVLTGWHREPFAHQVTGTGGSGQR